jgi:hypothetical protein
VRRGRRTAAVARGLRSSASSARVPTCKAGCVDSNDIEQRQANYLDGDDIRRLEWQANSFGSCLLLPTHSLSGSTTGQRAHVPCAHKRTDGSLRGLTHCRHHSPQDIRPPQGSRNEVNPVAIGKELSNHRIACCRPAGCRSFHSEVRLPNPAPRGNLRPPYALQKGVVGPWECLTVLVSFIQHPQNG